MSNCWIFIQLKITCFIHFITRYDFVKQCHTVLIILILAVGMTLFYEVIPCPVPWLSPPDFLKSYCVVLYDIWQCHTVCSRMTFSNVIPFEVLWLNMAYQLVSHGFVWLSHTDWRVVAKQESHTAPGSMTFFNYVIPSLLLACLYFVMSILS